MKPQAAGIAVSADGRRAIVANYYNDSVSLIDLAGGRVLAEQDLRPGKIDAADSGKPGGEFPFAVAWTSAGEAWVSAPRDRQLVSLSISADRLTVTQRIATIGEPTALLHDRTAHRLYATEDNADRLAVVDLATGRMIAEPRLGFPAALGGEPVRKGPNPNAIAKTRDGRLLVTLGGVNALAVVSPTDAGLAVTALVPTGWYPSAVATSADGRRVFVANRKSPPGPNPAGCTLKLAIYRGQPDACGGANQYIFQLEKAGLLQFPMPTERQLSRTTLQVADNVGLSRSVARDSTLIFVIEDDAQNGADHVDARRSVAFVVGPMVKQHALVSTRYTTINMLRTIESVLGLPPLGLNDSLAMPMADLFDPAVSAWSFRATASDVLRGTKLPIADDRFVAAASARCPLHDAAYWAAAMKGQDFRTEDHLDTAKFNAALWKGLGGGPEAVDRPGADLRASRQVLADGADTPCGAAFAAK